VTREHDENILFLPGELGERAMRTRLIAGDDTAYRECYEQHAPRLMRILVRLLRNQAWAEEILQDTFIAAFRSISGFRGDVGLSSWLARIATNRAFNAIRDESRRKRNAPPMDDDYMPGFEPHVEGRDLARKVMRILDDMEPPKKLALMLFAEGYTVAEIADITKEPRGTILARLSRSRGELASRMAEAGLVTDSMAFGMEGQS
jgi:RNA polymerase sigma-70 factor, ECF subfamily